MFDFGLTTVAAAASAQLVGYVRTYTHTDLEQHHRTVTKMIERSRTASIAFPGLAAASTCDFVHNKQKRRLGLSKARGPP